MLPALLIRNAGVPGPDITINEADEQIGGGFFLGGVIGGAVSKVAGEAVGEAAENRFSNIGIPLPSDEYRGGIHQGMKQDGYPQPADLLLTWFTNKHLQYNQRCDNRIQSCRTGESAC